MVTWGAALLAVSAAGLGALGDRPRRADYESAAAPGDGSRAGCFDGAGLSSVWAGCVSGRALSSARERRCWARLVIPSAASSSRTIWRTHSTWAGVSRESSEIIAIPLV